MIARKCDRCGKLYEFYDKFDDEYQNGFSMICKNIAGVGVTERTFTGKDLCPECMESLINWFNKQGEIKND